MGKGSNSAFAAALAASLVICPRFPLPICAAVLRRADHLNPLPLAENVRCHKPSLEVGTGKAAERPCWRHRLVRGEILARHEGELSAPRQKTTWRQLQLCARPYLLPLPELEGQPPNEEEAHAQM